MTPSRARLAALSAMQRTSLQLKLLSWLADESHEPLLAAIDLTIPSDDPSDECAKTVRVLVWRPGQEPCPQGENGNFFPRGFSDEEQVIITAVLEVGVVKFNDLLKSVGKALNRSKTAVLTRNLVKLGAIEKTPEGYRVAARCAAACSHSR